MSIKADWLWQLGQVTRQIVNVDQAFPIHQDKIFIEPYKGRPLLTATNGIMMTVIHATDSLCDGLDQPVTLSLSGALRQALSKGGKTGRPKQEVSIAVEGEAVTVTVTGPQARQIHGADAQSIVLPDYRTPGWRRIIPAPDRIEQSARKIVDANLDAMNGVNLEMLRILPRFGSGSVLIEPIMLPEELCREQCNLSVYIVREVDLMDQCFSLLSPMRFVGARSAPLPVFAYESEIEGEGEGESERKPEANAEAAS